MTDRLETLLPHLYRFALKLTGNQHSAEDLAHDTMLKALEQERQLISVPVLKPWLFRVAVNLQNDQHRRRRRVTEFSTDNTIPRPSIDVKQHLETLEDAEAALSALNGLPQRQRAVLHLLAVEELSISEIAEVLDISLESVRTNLHYARKAMRQRLPQLRDHHAPAANAHSSEETC